MRVIIQHSKPRFGLSYACLASQAEFLQLLDSDQDLDQEGTGASELSQWIQQALALSAFQVHRYRSEPHWTWTWTGRRLRGPQNPQWVWDQLHDLPQHRGRKCSYHRAGSCLARGENDRAPPCCPWASENCTEACVPDTSCSGRRPRGYRDNWAVDKYPWPASSDRLAICALPLQWLRALPAVSAPRGPTGSGRRSAPTLRGWQRPQRRLLPASWWPGVAGGGHRPRWSNRVVRRRC